MSLGWHVQYFTFLFSTGLRLAHADLEHANFYETRPCDFSESNDFHTCQNELYQFIVSSSIDSKQRSNVWKRAIEIFTETKYGLESSRGFIPQQACRDENLSKLNKRDTIKADVSSTFPEGDKHKHYKDVVRLVECYHVLHPEHLYIEGLARLLPTLYANLWSASDKVESNIKMLYAG
jgi:hypothetical protein